MRTTTLRLIVMTCTLTVLGAVRSMSMAQDKLAKGEIKQIAEEAFIYGFPMVMNYAVFYEYFVDKSSPEYKAPPNTSRLRSSARGSSTRATSRT